MISFTENKRMLGYELLSTYPNISHFVTTRVGGYSEGTYASFNCSPYSGDHEKHVQSNQQLLSRELSPHLYCLLIPRQVHGTVVRSIDEEFITATPEKQQELLEGVDALITNFPGYCICISTADCVPILIYDKRRQVVAAVHAGWRGTVESITSITLNKMKYLYGTQGEDVVAAIGPSISLESFEVGDEVYQAFQEKGFDMNKISSRNKETNKYHIDLWEANRLQFLLFGIPEKQIEVAGVCTYINHQEFFSARRLGINSGRIVSGIMINR